MLLTIQRRCEEAARRGARGRWRRRRGGGGWAWVVVAGWMLGSAGAATEGDYRTWMNRGRAQLENRNAAKAEEAFRSALALEAGSLAARRNLARAHLLAHRNAEALEPLQAVLALEPDSAATRYLLGLAWARQSRPEAAIPHFEAAVALDPTTAALRFQLAVAYQMVQRPEAALAQLREVIRLDPLHMGAHFRLATEARRAGDQAEAEQRHQDYLRLRAQLGEEARTPAALERCVYTAPELPPPNARPRDPAPVRFVDTTGEVFATDADWRVRTAAVLDYDDAGRASLVVVDAAGRVGTMTWGAGGRFELRRTGAEAAVNPRLDHAVVGNFHDDVPPRDPTAPGTAPAAWADLLLFGTDADSICLLKGTGPGAFADVTRASGLEGLRARRALWVDADHDGDLDLALAGPGGVALWRNRGDGRFEDLTAASGIGAEGEAADLAAVDLDANVATDLIVAASAGPSAVWMNQRRGTFARPPAPRTHLPSGLRVWADDWDNDGTPDLAFLSGTQVTVLTVGRAGRTQGSLDLPGWAVSGGEWWDYDNDGWLDLVVWGAHAPQAEPGQGAVRLWRNAGDLRWTDVTTEVGLAALRLPPLREGWPADYDGDGDTDLLLVSSEGRWHFLRNEGGNARAQLKVRLVGTKTNPLGLGTRVEVRAGDFQATRTVARTPLTIGVGRHRQLDVVQTVWANGVVDNQVGVSVGAQPFVIEEKNVAAGSCPYLYVWDGAGFRFVTDLLGNAPLGLPQDLHTVFAADPEEIVEVGVAAHVRARGKAFEIEITEELREVLYLDALRLLVVDHPAAVEVHSTDKLGPPPFAPSALWALRSPRPPRQAMGDDGQDRTAALQAIDGVFAPPGRPLPPPLRGLGHPLALTLDFGPLAAERPWLLALTGWIQYGDASVNVAAAQQPELPVLPPQLEAELADGTWQVLDVVVGMPAGKTKTILCALEGKLPPGTQRLRLTTSFELRWDRIVLGERDPGPVAVRPLSPSDATLRFRGFSELRARAPDHPPTPAYASVTAWPPWRTTPEGWCTRYGDVLALVQARDARLAVLNAGDALRVRFARPTLPRVPAGYVRRFFLEVIGWDKDADHNVVTGDTVAPWPVTAAEGSWEREYNTRWVPRDRFREGPAVRRRPKG